MISVYYIRYFTVVHSLRMESPLITREKYPTKFRIPTVFTNLKQKIQELQEHTATASAPPVEKVETRDQEVDTTEGN